MQSGAKRISPSPLTGEGRDRGGTKSGNTPTFVLPRRRLCRNTLGALRRAQGERINTWIYDQAIPFAVRLSNHERNCDTVSRGEGYKNGYVATAKALPWWQRHFALITAALVCLASHAAAQQLETLNASYASVTGSRIPLWIAKDAGLFEKYGLHVNLVVIAAGSAAIGALAGGDVEVLGAPGTTTLVSAAKGLSVAIIGTFGPGSWKLVAHPGITSVEELRGKTVGISRLGTGIEFATRRALLKLGFTPGKDVNILATGLAESNKRIMIMLQGKIDATLVSPDNMYEAETKGLKLSTLADLNALGIYTSASDLSARRDFLKHQGQRARAFMMAYCEAIWLGKNNKSVALASFRKQMRENDPRRLEVLYKNYVVDALPLKPYPMEEVIQTEIENLVPTMPEFRGKRAADFIDKTVLSELESEGFFARLSATYGK